MKDGTVSGQPFVREMTASFHTERFLFRTRNGCLPHRDQSDIFPGTMPSFAETLSQS